MSIRNERQRIAIVCVAGFVAVEVLFYFLSSSYFESRRELVGGISVPTFSEAQQTSTRIAFGVFGAAFAGVGFLAALWPRAIGHLLAVEFGLTNLVVSVLVMRNDGGPGVLGMTLLIVAVLMPLLAWFSFFHHARPAWAFLVAMCCVFAVVELFGAPRIRNALDISLWIAMILPALKVVAASALISLRGEYVEPTLAAA